MPVKKEAKKDQESKRCGFVAIIGRPNVGKSTLLNNIIGEKVAIVSSVPQTTRTLIKGILTEDRGQIIFIDTPGWHRGRDGLDRHMNQSCKSSLEGVDCVIHLADTSRSVGEEEQLVVDRLKHSQVPVIVGLNKIDLKGKFLAQYLSLWEEAKQKKLDEIKDLVFIPLSGKTGTQVDKLIDTIFTFLPEGPFHYESDIISDMPKKELAADIIREKFFALMREEVPHSIAIVVDEMRPAKGKTTLIRATVLIERDSQKEIVIGKNGATLKQVGMAARAELEALLETKVFLELYVKVQKNWRDDPSRLADMGYQGE